MDDYTCRTDAIGRRIYYYRQRRVPASDVPIEVREQLVCEGTRTPRSSTYIADLPKDLREELANYVPYAEIPYPLEPRYWKRRGELFGAETPSKAAYAKAYKAAGKCTYGEELRINLPSCFLEAVRNYDLERAKQLAIRAINLRVSIIDESVDMRWWDPTIVAAVLATPGAIDVVSKLPHYDYISLIERVMQNLEHQRSTLVDWLSDRLFVARANAILNDESGRLTAPVYIQRTRTRSMQEQPRDRRQEIRNAINDLVTILHPKPTLVEKVMPL